MSGVNGFVFVIDQAKADKDQQYVQDFTQERVNLCANYFEVGLAIIVNQHKKHQAKLKLSKEWFEREVFSIPDKRK